MDTVEIPLSRGLTAIVDAADFHSLGCHKWSSSGSSRMYAARRCDGKTVYMHRLLVGALADEEVDHINGNPLDNRRSNLRVASRAQNMANSIGRCGSSKYKGVCRKKQTGRWSAQIGQEGRGTHLGYFDKEEDAAAAYDQAAVSTYGEFAKTNKSMGLL